MKHFPCGRQRLSRELLNCWDRMSQFAEQKSNNALINVISYGFIRLISLISAANVFNTVSSNIALRRRDSGMLRSIGLRQRQMGRMMSYE